MFRYYLWPVAEKAVSYLPLGEKLYEFVGYQVNKGSKGTGGNPSSSFRILRKAKELVPSGGTVVDVGTGWFHREAFLLWLIGDYRVYLFDVADKAKLAYIRNYLNHIRHNIDLFTGQLPIDRDEALRKLDAVLRMETRREIYDACNFVRCTTTRTDTPFLPEDSVDFMLSNCVLNHIRPHILLPELVSLRRMLKPEGRMYHLIGHDDHWTFHDRSANQFNYFRYSDRNYRLIFETMEYQNRFVKQEWLKIFEKTKLRVDDYYAEITDCSREQIAKLPHIDARFAKYPREELATIYSYFLLAK